MRKRILRSTSGSEKAKHDGVVVVVVVAHLSAEDRSLARYGDGPVVAVLAIPQTLSRVRPLRAADACPLDEQQGRR